MGLVFNTGFDRVDEALGGGIRKGEITVIGGRPGMGKTVIAARIAVNLAEQNVKVLYIDLEMNSVLISYLLEESAKNETVSNNLEVHAVTPKCGIKGVADAIHSSEADVVIIDYVQLCCSRKEWLENGALEFATKGLFDKAFIWCSQLPREIEGRADKQPLIDDVRGIVNFGCYPDKTLLLYRNSYYDPEYQHYDIFISAYEGSESCGRFCYDFDELIDDYTSPYLENIKRIKGDENA